MIDLIVGIIQGLFMAAFMAWVHLNNRALRLSMRDFQDYASVEDSIGKTDAQRSAEAILRRTEEEPNDAVFLTHEDFFIAWTRVDHYGPFSRYGVYGVIIGDWFHTWSREAFLKELHRRIVDHEGRKLRIEMAAADPALFLRMKEGAK